MANLAGVLHCPFTPIAPSTVIGGSPQGRVCDRTCPLYMHRQGPDGKLYGGCSIPMGVEALAQIANALTQIAVKHAPVEEVTKPS